MEKQKNYLKLLMNNLEEIYDKEETKLETILDLAIDIISVQQTIINLLD